MRRWRRAWRPRRRSSRARASWRWMSAARPAMPTRPHWTSPTSSATLVCICQVNRAWSNVTSTLSHCLPTKLYWAVLCLHDISHVHFVLVYSHSGLHFGGRRGHAAHAGSTLGCGARGGRCPEQGRRILLHAAAAAIPGYARATGRGGRRRPEVGGRWRWARGVLGVVFGVCCCVHSL